MVRGKDGFTSLLIEEHGGSAESIVDEENGQLISTILRQYFMSLKVLGRWKNWTAQLGKHWGGVHSNLHDVHPVREPMRPGSPEHDRLTKARKTHHEGRDGNEKNTLPSLVGKAQQTPVQGNDEGASDSEDESMPRSDLPAVPAEPSEEERKLVLARKVMRKWWRLTGLKGHPAMCEAKNDDFGVLWTRGIAPQVEGRIVCIGETHGQSGA